MFVFFLKKVPFIAPEGIFSNSIKRDVFSTGLDYISYYIGKNKIQSFYSKLYISICGSDSSAVFEHYNT